LKRGNTSHIFLNCTADWYTNGVPGCGDLEQTIEKIKSIRAQIGAKRIITLGSSMGAFGACLYGGALNADLTICFGPELILGLPTGLSLQNLDLVDKRYCSADSLGLPQRLVLVAGTFAPVDMICARRFYQNACTNMIILPFERHAVSKALHVRRELKPLLLSLMAELNPQKQFKVVNYSSIEFPWAQWFKKIRHAKISTGTIVRYAVSLNSCLSEDDIEFFRRMFKKRGYKKAALRFAARIKDLREIETENRLTVEVASPIVEISLPIAV
jgi:hypothetical protein